MTGGLTPARRSPLRELSRCIKACCPEHLQATLYPSPNCDLQLGEGRRCAELVEAVGVSLRAAALVLWRRSNLLALDHLVMALLVSLQGHILTGRLLQLERFAFRPRNDMMISEGLPS